MAASQAGLTRVSQRDFNARGAGRHYGPAPLCVFMAPQTGGGTGLKNPLAGDGFEDLRRAISHRGDYGAA